MSQCAVCLEPCLGKCAALSGCGHVYHIRCIGKWFDVKCGSGSNNASTSWRRQQQNEESAPCPTCKKEFKCSETTTIFLDVKMDQLMASGAVLSQRLDAGGGHAASATTPTPGNRRRSSSGVDDGGDNNNGDGRYAECARRLRFERQKLHDALDQGETLKAEIRALRETARTGEELNAEIARLNRDLRTSKLAQDALTSKVRRSASEIKRLTDKERTMETRLKTYENKERLERDVSANAASEREMLKRLEGNDPKLAMETLVRNLVAKNKQMTSQQEAYHALAKQIREKEKEINALEQKVRAYKSRATSTTVNVAEPAPAPEMTTTNKKTVGGKEWEDPVLDSITGSKKPRFAAAKSLRSSGKDAWIREMAAASSRSAKTKTKGPKADSTINLAEEEEEDDVLADILNDVDVRMDRKRRAAAAGADSASTGGALKKRPAGSFLKSSPKAPTSTGTFIRHGADGRGGRGKFFVER